MVVGDIDKVRVKYILYYGKNSFILKEDFEMKTKKFEGRMNEIMLTMYKAAQDDKGIIDPRDMKAVGLTREIIGYALQMNLEIENLKKEVRILKEEKKDTEKKIGA